MVELQEEFITITFGTFAVDEFFGVVIVFPVLAARK